MASLVVMITGCTEGGIGYELAKAFTALKCQVFATARRLEAMAGLPELGVQTLVLDVTSTDSIKAAVDAIIEKAGRIDILVNNAGAGCIGPLAELPLDDIRANFETNVFGLVATVQAVVPYMVKQGKGKIVNIGSIVGYVATPWGGSYCATKAAVHSFTDTMRLELKPFGITVVLVAPGAITSNIAKNNMGPLSKKRWKLFAPFSDHINKRASVSQGSASTPTPVFARKVAMTVLQPAPPAHFVYGAMSGLVLLLRWLPIWLVDRITAPRFGLAGQTMPKVLKLE